METPQSAELLESGLRTLGVASRPDQRERLLLMASALLKWNARVNLTAITNPREVIDKHLLDSAAALRSLGPEPLRILDLGAGPGFPGLPWAVLRDDLDVTLVDAVQKKVAFMKTVIATLDLSTRVRAVHRHVEPADPLGRFDVVVSRAFMDVGPWLDLARHFVTASGQVIALAARVPAGVVDLARGRSFELESISEFTLPLSGDPRVVISFRLR